MVKIDFIQQLNNQINGIRDSNPVKNVYFSAAAQALLDESIIDVKGVNINDVLNYLGINKGM